MKKDKPRTVGRPRAKVDTTGQPAREAIVLAAAQLFGEQGYAATSTREIADVVGIRQPSLFYHFRRKEDLLRAIVEEAGADLLSILPGLEKRAGPAAQKLYELVYADVHFLLTEPHGIGKLMGLPELRQGEFGQAVDRKRKRLISTYRKLIKLGIEEGHLEVSDLTVATHTVVGMGEAVWNWYQPSRRWSPAKIAEQIADHALRALLKDPADLGRLKRLSTVSGVAATAD